MPAAAAPVGYIVMEYVGGTSLKQIRKARNAPLPPDQAVAYIIEIAPALDYLHTQGLAYCDFKPDNVMQTDEQLKLIDLGAVIAMDDLESALYGTVGYQAPEISQTGPTVASDVYTVGRTLAVLVMDVPQEHGHFVEQLPGPATVPVLAKHESLYRAIKRATDPDPEQRFSSIEEMADQLTGVLHEIVAAETNVAQPRSSNYFSPQRAVFGAGRDVAVRTGSGDRGTVGARGRSDRLRRRGARHHQRHAARSTRVHAAHERGQHEGRQEYVGRDTAAAGSRGARGRCPRPAPGSGSPSWNR